MTTRRGWCIQRSTEQRASSQPHEAQEASTMEVTVSPEPLPCTVPLRRRPSVPAAIPETLVGEWCNAYAPLQEAPQHRRLRRRLGRTRRLKLWPISPGTKPLVTQRAPFGNDSAHIPAPSARILLDATWCLKNHFPRDESR
jgi:hypothetical protein